VLKKCEEVNAYVHHLVEFVEAAHSTFPPWHRCQAIGSTETIPIALTKLPVPGAAASLDDVSWSGTCLRIAHRLHRRG
jgi:hypothetical protein